MIDSGVLYVATDAGYLREALQSHATVKAHHPDVKTAIVTTDHRDVPGFDHQVVLDAEDGEWKDGIAFKIRALAHTPFVDTLFLDTDTFMLEPCFDEIMDTLEWFDMAMAHAPNDTSRPIIDGKKRPAMLPYNTGVVAYRKTEAVRDMIELWAEDYEERFEDYPHDQPPLMAALAKSRDVRVHVLQSTYNFRLPSVQSVPQGRVKILHGRPWNLAHIVNRINTKTGNRAWVPSTGKMVYADSKV